MPSDKGALTYAHIKALEACLEIANPYEPAIYDGLHSPGLIHQTAMEAFNIIKRAMPVAKEDDSRCTATLAISSLGNTVRCTMYAGHDGSHYHGGNSWNKMHQSA